MTDPARPGAPWRRIAVLALLAAGLALLASSDTVHGAVMELLEAGNGVIEQHPVAGALLFIVFAAISAMLAFVSAAVIVPVAVVTWGVPLALVMLWLGWILGGVVAYGVARAAGRPAIRWFSASALDRLEWRIQPDTPFGLVVLFQLAMPSEIPGYVLGLVRFPFLRYLLAVALAELPYAVATVFVGAGFVEQQVATVLGVGLALAALSVGAVYLLATRLKHQQAAAGPPDV